MLIVRSFLELMKFLLQQPTIHDKELYIVSAFFNQDLLEVTVAMYEQPGGGMSIPQCGRH